MADKGDTETLEEGPGAKFTVFQDCEKMMDSLKMLDYDTKFCAKFKMKPFHKQYFSISTTSGEQFPHFASLAAWLINEAGISFEQPQELIDDPNATVANIIEATKTLGGEITFPSMRLKDGSGPHVVYVLQVLTDAACKQKNLGGFEAPHYPEEAGDQNEIIEEDDTELTWTRKGLGGAGDDMFDDADLDIEDDGNLLLDLNAVNDPISSGPSNSGDGPQQTESSTKIDKVLASNTDAQEWQLEVERVLPSLKVTLRTDNKDWRVHHESMKTSKTQVRESIKSTEIDLNKLHNEVARTLEKILSREKYIGSQLEGSLGAYKDTQTRLQREKEKYRHASGGIMEKQKILNLITDELDRVKAEMSERGSSMTDAKPLKRIRDAIEQIKKELIQISIRTGVVEHGLIQAKLSEKREQAASGSTILSAAGQHNLSQDSHSAFTF